MYLVLMPYIDDVLIFFMGMIGGSMEGLDVPFGREILHVHFDTCFREEIGQAMMVSLDLLLPCGMSHLHLMRTWEEHVMAGWIGRQLAYEGMLSHGGVTKGGEEELQHSPVQLLEDKQHLG